MSKQHLWQCAVCHPDRDTPATLRSPRRCSVKCRCHRRHMQSTGKSSSNLTTLVGIHCNTLPASQTGCSIKCKAGRAFLGTLQGREGPAAGHAYKAASHKGLYADLHEDATPAFVNQCMHLSDLAIMGDSPDALIMAPSLLCTSLVTSMTRLNRLASRSPRHSNTCLNLFQSAGPQHGQINLDSGSITLGPTCLRSTPGILCIKFWRGVQAALQLISGLPQSL